MNTDDVLNGSSLLIRVTGSFTVDFSTADRLIDANLRGEKTQEFSFITIESV